MDRLKQVEGFEKSNLYSTVQIMNSEINTPSKNNAGYVGEMLLKALQGRSNSFNLADAEAVLRELHSRVYLVAIPIEKFPGFTTVYPSMDADYKPYALWVCMNGHDEYIQTLHKHKISPIENQVNLHHCGFLTPKKTTD